MGRVVVEKAVVLEIVKKSSTFCGTRRFVAVFT
jgi:hypothetical protein